MPPKTDPEKKEETAGLSLFASKNVYGSFPVFNAGDNWNIFKDQVSLFFDLNSIDNPETRRSFLLVYAGKEVSTQAYNVSAPKKPSEITYKVLMEKLTAHFVPE